MQATLLILHFLGLTMGFTVPFSNIVMASLIAKAQPNERPILGRFPFAVTMVGNIGLALLWTTGPALLFTKYGGFAGVPWQFHVKLLAALVLTLGVGFIHMNKRKALAGDAAAMARIQNTGKLTMVAGLTALVFAVLTFK